MALWGQITSTAGAGLPLVALWQLRFLAEEEGHRHSSSSSGGGVCALRACVRALLSAAGALDPSMHPRLLLVAAWLIRPSSTPTTTSTSSPSGDSNVLIDANVFDLLQPDKGTNATLEATATSSSSSSSSSDPTATSSDAKVYFNRSVRVASAVAQWLDTRVATVLLLALRTTR